MMAVLECRRYREVCEVMIFGIVVTIIAIMGLIYGIMIKNKTYIIASAALLVLIIIIGMGYYYLYSQNPY